MSSCPKCGAKGRSIEAVTLEAQVTSERLGEISERDGWLMCTSGDCEVVYFREEDAVVLGQTRAIPFHKSDDPDRLVCFCFEHSVADLEADLRDNGTSTIQAAIKAACKAGRDDCERKNPQGRCCLGNVGKVLKEGAEENESCCAPPAPEDTSARNGLFASGGALVAAAFSSACCWLPLAATGLGASSASVGAFFEAWRFPLFMAAVLLLGAGFYLVYRRPRCTPDPRVQRLNRGMLWVTAALVASFALFPEYVGAILGGGGEAFAEAPGATTVRYQVQGMTCAGCEGHTRKALEAIPGVVSVAVSYRDGSADVLWSGAPDDPAIAAALAPLGYEATALP